MNDTCYNDCEKKIREAISQNIAISPNQIKGHIWCALCDGKNDKPNVFGPIRYNAPNGKNIYKKIVEIMLSDENKKYAGELMDNDVDFMVFVRAADQRITLFT